MYVQYRFVFIHGNNRHVVVSNRNFRETCVQYIGIMHSYDLLTVLFSIYKYSHHGCSNMNFRRSLM